MFFGTNRAGKTNLLDAIHYLCLTKSAFIPTDSHHIKHGEAFFTIKGEFELKEKSWESIAFLRVVEKTH